MKTVQKPLVKVCSVISSPIQISRCGSVCLAIVLYAPSKHFWTHEGLLSRKYLLGTDLYDPYTGENVCTSIHDCTYVAVLI